MECFSAHFRCVDPAANEEDLRQFFEKIAPVSSVRLVRDRATNIGKGFGYVNFQSQDHIRQVLSLNGAKFHNRSLRVFKAVGKDRLSKQRKAGGAFARQRFFAFGCICVAPEFCLLAE